MDLAGVPSYEGIGGRSLVPVLDDSSATVRDEVLIEDDFPGALTMDILTPAKTRTLVTADLRLTRHSDGSEQLFDTAADPDEVPPGAATARAGGADMYERLAEALMEADDLARGMPLHSPPASPNVSASFIPA